MIVNARDTAKTAKPSPRKYGLRYLTNAVQILVLKLVNPADFLARVMRQATGVSMRG